MTKQTGAADRPNVLFLISHDIGRRFGCYGNEQIVTPNIDAFAETAHRFDGHYCQWPLCGPSRATIFTGCRPPTTRRYDNEPFFTDFRHRTGHLPATLPEAFRTAGYRTAAFGFVYHDQVDPPSWSDGHLQVPEWADGPGDGDDPFAEVPEQLLLGWRSREAKELVRDRWRGLVAQGISREDLADPATARAARGPAVERFDGPDNAYPDGVATDAAVAWLRAYGTDRATAEPPFFVALGFVAGHTPFRAPARDWDVYDRARLTLPAYRDPPKGSPAWVSGDSEPAQFYTTHGYTRPWRADDAQSRELLHGHYAAITYTDRQIGRVLDTLREAGLKDTTIVVITSDHGFHDGHHGYWGKHNLWDQSLQVPLLVREPHGDGGGTVDALTEHIDLFPTLCDLADLPIPRHIEGKSLAPLLHDRTQYHKEAVFAHRRHMWHDRLQVYAEAHTVRSDHYRYTRYVTDAGETIYEELFDYVHDPEERRNLCVEPKLQADVHSVLETLRRIIAKKSFRLLRPEHPER